MKIKRFFAPEMRQAIRRVRETLGPDAVILSNKSVEGGVEIVAAVDFDETAFAAAKGAPAPAMPAPAPETPRQVPASANRPARPKKVAAAPSQVEWSQDPVLVEMRREMQALRRLMESELGDLAWRELGQQGPQTRELLRRLLDLGLPPALARGLAERVGESADAEQGWRKALYFLAGEIDTGGADLIDTGGVVAIIGPTGVGKTTTIAKLAARFALRHGARHLALVTTDHYRIGAREQLHTYGRILNVPVKSAASAEELETVLNTLADRRLVLIDTAGMGPRDVRLSEQLALLRVGDRGVRRYLTVAANTERAALERVLQAFGEARPDACVLTKLDEAGSLGGVLAALIGNGLPLAYVTDGQRVPEDLHTARAHTLIGRAAQLAEAQREAGGDGHHLLTLGGGAAHAHV
jgi:flagellar biosynthesis protein FlhF